VAFAFPPRVGIFFFVALSFFGTLMPLLLAVVVVVNTLAIFSHVIFDLKN
jgi:hypothetical protein